MKSLNRYIMEAKNEDLFCETISSMEKAKDSIDIKQLNNIYDSIPLYKFNDYQILEISKKYFEYREYLITNHFDEIEEDLYEMDMNTTNFKDQNEYNDKNYERIVTEINENHKLTKTCQSLFKNTLVLETLKSFSAREFIKAINTKFNNVLKVPEPEDKKNNLSNNVAFSCMLYIDLEDEKNPDANTLIELCKYYRYYITIRQPNGYTIFEPLDTKEVTKEIKRKYNNKVYHLCRKTDLKSILDNGLKVASVVDNSEDVYFLDEKTIKKIEKIKPKTLREKISKKLTYRFFTHRTFVFYSESNNKEILFDKIVKSLNRNKGGWAIIEIDLGKHQIPVFTDTMMKDEEDIHFGYVTIDIPNKLIKQL